MFSKISRKPVPVLTSFGLLSSCRQINWEVGDLHHYRYTPKLGLRLGENIYPHRFFRANGENSRFPKKRFNWAVQLLEISGAFFKLFSSNSLDYYLHGNVPRKDGWLLEIFPNLGRIHVHGYIESEILKEFQLENFQRICFGTVFATYTRVRVVFI